MGDEIILELAEVPHQVTRLGRKILVLTAGMHLKIETSPGGDEILDVVVPEGKAWKVNVTIAVYERDA